MKKSLLTTTIILLLSVSPCFAISFSYCTVGQGDSGVMHIGLTDVPEPLITAAFIMEYEPSQMGIVGVDINESCWDKGMSNTVKDPKGQPPGTLIITAGNLSLCAPDDNGDIGIATIEFLCLTGNCSGQQIKVDTVPGYDSVVGNSAGVYDEDISPNYFDFDSPCTTTTTTPTITTTTKDYICVPETIYGGHSQEVQILRYFRDNILSKTQEGQELIRLYYQWSSFIVKAMEEDEAFKQEIKDMIDEVLPMISQ